MSKHTKGPWVAQKDPNAINIDDWCIGIENAPIDCIAVCSERNARLIAAAPELYEVAQAIIDAMTADQSLHGVLLFGIAPRARAAIAKATGEPT